MCVHRKLIRERMLISQISKHDHNKSNVAKWLKSTDIPNISQYVYHTGHWSNPSFTRTAKIGPIFAVRPILPGRPSDFCKH